MRGMMLGSPVIKRVSAVASRGDCGQAAPGSRYLPLVVVYDDARFDLARDESSTWEPAIDHGLGQGLLREWLDFPADDTTGPK